MPATENPLPADYDHFQDSLLVEHAHRDLRAFEALVERLRALIQRQCLQRVHDWQHAEDLAQETFIRAYLKLGQLDDATHCVPWLRRIAANLCNDFLRRPQRAEVAVAAPERAPCADDLPLAGLECLPTETRRIVDLFYQGGYRHAEIAARLGLTVAAVKARLGRAKAVLRRESTMSAQRSPFTQRVMDKLADLQSPQPDARAGGG